MKNECCKTDIQLRTFDIIGDKDIQLSILCRNLVILSEADPDPITKSILEATAKALFKCNLKGKTVVSRKHKYTWKRIIEDNIN